MGKGVSVFETGHLISLAFSKSQRCLVGTEDTAVTSGFRSDKADEVWV